MSTQAVSVRQPWAWALVHGFKDVENRSWKPSKKRLNPGDALVIHASKRFDVAGYRWMWAHWEAAGLKLADLPAREDFVLGALVGAVRFVGVVEASDSPWFFGPLGWAVTEGTTLDEPIPCKGRLGLWPVDDAVSWQCAEERAARVK